MSQVVTPLAITFVMQAMVAVLQMTVPVLAPVLTAEAGLPPESVGYFWSVAFVGSLWFLTINNQIMPRTGPLRLLQLGNLLVAVGLVLMLSGHWLGLLLGMLCIGIGYGPTPPGGSQILAKWTPPEMRGLVFSIKQAGVPIGAAATGVASPWLAATFGLDAALLVVAGAMVVAVLAVQPWRSRFDAERTPGHPIYPARLISARILLEPPKAMRGVPGLISLTYAGAAFAVAQGSVFTYLVTYLVEDARLSLAVAGLGFSALQVVGAIGRVANGLFSDLVGSGRLTLILLAVLSAVTAWVLSLVTASWSQPAIVLVCALAGFAVASWNGVYLAEIARIAPLDRVGDVTAGSTFFTFIGYVVGPVIFAGIVQLTGSWATAFLAVAAIVLTGAGALLVGRRGRARPAE